MILDLLSTNDILATTKETITNVIPSKIATEVEKLCDNDIYPDELYEILEEYETKIDDFFCNKYNYIRSFHACRIIDENSYLQHGIKKLCKPLIIELALERFSKHKSRKSILNACENLLVDEQDKAVFFFSSFNDAKSPLQNHYLKSGPEVLQGLVSTLNLSNQGILTRQGRACIIECHLPIKYIKPVLRNSFWKEFIISSHQKSFAEAIRRDLQEWAFATLCNISPEYIKHFHYLEESEYIYNRPIIH